MKFDNIIPVLVMIVYVALLFFKRRKLKVTNAKKKVPQKTASGPAPGIKRLFPKFGERLKTFFSELEQQFRMEAEKARTKNFEPDQGQGKDVGQGEGEGRSMVFDPREKEVESLLVTDPGTPTVIRVKKEKLRQRMVRKSGKPCPLGVDIRPCRRKLRSAVVWSEILAPPLAIRRDKRPWEN